MRLLLLGQALRLVVVHELGVRTAAGNGLAYARLHLSSTLLVLIATMLVPVPDEGSVAAVLLPVALGFVGVQLACAIHVIVSNLVRRRRSAGAHARR
jgi:hypothetical protein